ncbi:nucleotide sugar dehydrogenase [Candidatus Woesearchaeota archaeon]|nr:nucleotide sugar dehydrogenase [Candidatus Woesearchaeota archaeon]
MRISIFGLGYIGAVCTAAFAELGHQVIGVDVMQYKVDAINGGEAPLKEKGLDALIYKGVKKQKIVATRDTEKAIFNSDISFICVGTPPKKNGEIDLSFLKRVCGEIGAVLKRKQYHILVIRSTMLPGSLDILKEILENGSGKKEGKDFHLATNPEFLREGSAIKDFFNPPYVIIGADNFEVGKKVLEIYRNIKAKKFVVRSDIAQMIKYASNSWHAVKISFANEIGVLCKAQGIDSKKLMRLFCEDTQLNISSYYLKPGFAYGGSCLPKDVAAIQKRADKLKVVTPLLNAASKSNIEHIARAVKLIQSTKKRKIGVIGITFKPDTDDIRGNPILLVINRLVNQGYNVKIYDPLITKANLKAIKKSYRNEVFDLITKEDLKEKVVEIEGLFTSLNNVVKQDVIVISNRDESLQKVIKELDENKIVLDLQNILDKLSMYAKAVSLV